VNFIFFSNQKNNKFLISRDNDDEEEKKPDIEINKTNNCDLKPVETLSNEREDEEEVTKKEIIDDEDEDDEETKITKRENFWKERASSNNESSTISCDKSSLQIEESLKIKNKIPNLMETKVRPNFIHHNQPRSLMNRPLVRYPNALLPTPQIQMHSALLPPPQQLLMSSNSIMRFSNQQQDFEQYKQSMFFNTPLYTDFSSKSNREEMKRKTENDEKTTTNKILKKEEPPVKPPVLSEEVKKIIVEDPEYLTKLDQQKKMREAILKKKEERRLQRAKEENQNLAVEKVISINKENDKKEVFQNYSPMMISQQPPQKPMFINQPPLSVPQTSNFIRNPTFGLNLNRFQPPPYSFQNNGIFENPMHFYASQQQNFINRANYRPLFQNVAPIRNNYFVNNQVKQHQIVLMQNLSLMTNEQSILNLCNSIQIKDKVCLFEALISTFFNFSSFYFKVVKINMIKNKFEAEIMFSDRESALKFLKQFNRLGIERAFNSTVKMILFVLSIISLTLIISSLNSYQRIFWLYRVTVRTYDNSLIELLTSNVNTRFVLHAIII